MTRIGIIGAGAITRRAHLPLLQQAGAELAAFASRTRASAEAAVQQAGTGVVCDDWRDLVRRDDVDAVVVATPNVLHEQQALAAISAGKHVLMEKPFTATVAEADRVLAAAEAAGVVVMAAHNTRFAAPVQAARDAVRSGLVGEVGSFRASFSHAGPLAAWSAEATWFLEPELAGGGVLLDLGVHLVDAVRAVLGDELTGVTALLAGLDANGLEHDAMVLATTRRGAVGSLHAGWRSTSADFSLVVVGDRGTLRAAADGATLTRADGTVTALELPTSEDTVQAAFVRAVGTGRAEHPDGHDGRAAVAVVQAAYEAARTGRRVEL